MRVLLAVSSAFGLILTILPSILFFVDVLDLQIAGTVMTLGMVLWFAGDVPRVSASLRRQ